MPNQRKYYKVIGMPGKENIRLCYTSNRETCTRELVKEGWKRSDLKFVPMYRVKDSPEESVYTYFEKGDIVTVEPVGAYYKSNNEYPAAHWIEKDTEVELLEDAISGTLDVFDVKVNGKEESIYGFNIKV